MGISVLYFYRLVWEILSNGIMLRQEIENNTVEGVEAKHPKCKYIVKWEKVSQVSVLKEKFVR